LLEALAGGVEAMSRIPYSIDGSTILGSVMVRSGTLPCMPPVPMMMAFLARMCIVSARSSMLPFCQKLSRRAPVSGCILRV